MIEDLMKVQKISAFQVVIPIAKEMVAHEKNPLILMAVAVEITTSDNE